jgi:DivIVA domain-containing protein
MWVWVIVIVALTGGVVAVAVGRGGSMSEVYDDRPDVTVPSGRSLTSDDLRDVRFSTAVRGYRMDEVDALLARIRADLIARETGPADERVQVVDRRHETGPADERVQVVDRRHETASPSTEPTPVVPADTTDDDPEPPVAGRRVGDRFSSPSDGEPT